MSGISRIIDVRPGEGVIVGKATATLFGIIAAHTMLETARDALFLQSMPPSALTYVYGILAGLALVVSRANALYVRRFGRRNALIFTLGAAARRSDRRHGFAGCLAFLYDRNAAAGGERRVYQHFAPAHDGCLR